MIAERQRFAWDVQVQNGHTGEVTETVFEAYWSPESVSSESVQEAAAAQATVLSHPDPKQRAPHAGLSAVLR